VVSSASAERLTIMTTDPDVACFAQRRSLGMPLLIWMFTEKYLACGKGKRYQDKIRNVTRSWSGRLNNQPDLPTKERLETGDGAPPTTGIKHFC
jgi:hypothetical protein